MRIWFHGLPTKRLFFFFTISTVEPATNGLSVFDAKLSPCVRARISVSAGGTEEFGYYVQTIIIIDNPAVEAVGPIFDWSKCSESTHAINKHINLLHFASQFMDRSICERIQRPKRPVFIFISLRCTYLLSPFMNYISMYLYVCVCDACRAPMPSQPLRALVSVRAYCSSWLWFLWSADLLSDALECFTNPPNNHYLLFVSAQQLDHRTTFAPPNVSDLNEFFFRCFFVGSFGRMIDEA